MVVEQVSKLIMIGFPIYHFFHYAPPNSLSYITKFVRAKQLFRALTNVMIQRGGNL